MLADGARFVICYDHRDTGRSATYPPGRPGYAVADLVADAGGILDACGVPSARVVGVSAGGAFAQRLALDHFCTLSSQAVHRVAGSVAVGLGRHPPVPLMIVP